MYWWVPSTKEKDDGLNKNFKEIMVENAPDLVKDKFKDSQSSVNPK